MRKILWIGDAVVSTGFAKCTHKVLEEVRKTWEVHVLGINFLGDPGHGFPYDIYPCWSGGDGFGVGRTAQLVEGLRPDLVLIQNDPWNIARYVSEIRKVSPHVPVVASMPIDGKNCKAKELNSLALAIMWTEFGRTQLLEGGYMGQSVVIPLGVDLEMYKPQDRMEARRRLGLPGVPEDAFIVGNLNRNQPRKRLDLTVRYFAEWVRQYHRDDAFLFLYVAPTGEFGYDVKQLMKYYGFHGKNKRLILMQPAIGQGQPEEDLPGIYATLDVQISTTQGEGWGLTTMEGMACGIPQLLPDWAALGEWTEDAALKAPCTSTSATPNFGNAIGGIADEKMFVVALERMRASSETRKLLSERGLDLVSKPEFRWENIGAQFAAQIDQIVPAEVAVEAIA